MENKDKKYKQVISENQDMIFRLCCSYLVDTDLRKDLFQNILIRIWKGLNSFENRSNISTWIYRIAVNTSIDFLRNNEKEIQTSLAQLHTTLDGKYLHKNIYEMASASGYHLCKNHPFIDGNKRIALIATYTFLYVNGYELKLGEKEMYLLIMGIANNSISKQELTDYIKKATTQLKTP